jgi:DNA polymerase-3 subunit alpha
VAHDFANAIIAEIPPGDILFTHLHNHTEYSLLDGLSRIAPMVQRAKELGMEALSITDHGGLYGAIEFYTACKEAGIKPIIGLESYLAPESRHSKTPADKNPYHLLLLARNMEGYRNLLQLSSKAHLEGFYYKPRVDRELLQQYSGGLIALSGCLSAEVPRQLLEGRIEEAKETALWYHNIFDGNFFLELQRHGNIPDQNKVNDALLELSKATGIPLVATNDSHYIHQEDAPFQDILICIHTNTNIYDDKRLKMSDDSYYLKSTSEMEELFSDLPQAIAATQSIADMCDLELDFSQTRLPEYKSPGNMSAGEYLSKLCYEGLNRRYTNPSPEAHQRLAYELDVIEKTQFDNYMLVVWDIAAFTRDNNILFGVRGSAAASLVLYCLGITDIDPLQYRLVFERFLNLERREMPDIDMDFQDDRREEVIAYVRHKYGGDHVAQIITFGTLGAKAAIRDTGRALGMSYPDVDRVAKLIPLGSHSLDEALEASGELKDIYETDSTMKTLVDTARHLEGVVRHASTHAAGVVITKDPLVEYLPLQRPIRADSSDGMAMTQFPMEPIAKLGLLKMDFLGLTNLTILSQAVRTVAQRRGVHLDLAQIPLDNKDTFDLLSSGETTGVFQLEGSGMRRYIQKLKPNSIADVSAMIALYRPGPMEHIDTFIDAKHGNAAIRYPHPALKDILEETYGVIVYQDQVLLIAQAFAGYSLGEADVVRKAMGKKIAEIMQHESKKFVAGAVNKGFSRELSEEVFQLIEPFAGYAFNKAHSVSYAMIAYWTAYFKANYPEEYMAAVLNAHSGQADKISSDVSECLRIGIPVLLPDVNRSESDFSIDISSDGKPAIRFGLANVKNVGAMAVTPLVEERKENGPYKSVEDICRRADLGSINRRSVECLIKVGALDSIGDRGALLASIDRIMSLAQREAQLKGSGQTTMFNLFGEEVSTPINSIELKEGEVLQQEKLAWERELLGTHISENPLRAIISAAPPNTIISRDALDNSMDGKRVNIVGQVSSHRSGMTRNGKPFAAVVLDLLGGNIEIMVWSNSYDKTRELWYEGSLVEVVGKIRLREDEISITCDAAKPYSIEDNASYTPDSIMPQPLTEAPLHSHNDASANDSTEPSNVKNGLSRDPSTKIWIRLEESNNPRQDEHMLRGVVKLLMNYPGEGTVGLRIKTEGKTVIGDLPFISVKYCQELHQELVAIVGDGGVEIMGLAKEPA